MDSKENQIVAYVDQMPSSEPRDVEFTYDYHSDFVLGDVSHQGLGFQAETEGTSSYEKEIKADENINDEVGQMSEEILAEVSPPGKNSGFLSIGGMKLYTQDISDEESDEEDNRESLDEESNNTSEPGEAVGSSESDSSEESSDSDLDIDDEVAEDYLEGIGGSDNVLNSKWLMEQVLDESDDDSSSNSLDETVEKLGGIALQDASREYGLKKPKSRKRYSKPSKENLSLAIDELMLIKDPRTVSVKKKHVARFPRSWPLEAQKSKTSRNFPGKFCSSLFLSWMMHIFIFCWEIIFSFVLSSQFIIFGGRVACCNHAF